MALIRFVTQFVGQTLLAAIIITTTITRGRGRCCQLYPIASAFLYLSCFHDLTVAPPARKRKSSIKNFNLFQSGIRNPCTMRAASTFAGAPSAGVFCLIALDQRCMMGRDAVSLIELHPFAASTLTLRHIVTMAFIR
jgi:hypothetical protein